MRLGTSLLIAAREKGAEPRRFVDEFLRALPRRAEERPAAPDRRELATRARAVDARSLRQAHEWIDNAFADGVARFVELVGFGRELRPISSKGVGARS